MSEKYKLPDNIGKIIQAKIPEIKKDFADMGNNTYSIVNKSIISMLTEQALSWFKLRTKISQSDNFKQYSKVAISALEKQVAKKPKILGDGDIKACFCAECGTIVLKDQKHCFECGQKLKWEE